MVDIKHFKRFLLIQVVLLVLAVAVSLITPYFGKTETDGFFFGLIFLFFTSMASSTYTERQPEYMMVLVLVTLAMPLPYIGITELIKWLW